MGGAIRADNARAVNGEQHGQVLQRHIVQQLVVSALQKGGINGDNRLGIGARHACGKGYGVLLGDADIKAAVGELLGKGHQAAAFYHGGGDGNQPFIGLGLVGKPIGKDFGVGGRGRGLGSVGFGFQAA